MNTKKTIKNFHPYGSFKDFDQAEAFVKASKEFAIKNFLDEKNNPTHVVRPKKHYKHSNSTTTTNK